MRLILGILLVLLRSLLPVWPYSNPPGLYPTGGIRAGWVSISCDFVREIGRRFISPLAPTGRVVAQA